MSPAETAEPIDMLFGCGLGWAHKEPWHVLADGHIGSFLQLGNIDDNGLSPCDFLFMFSRNHGSISYGFFSR